MCLPVTAADVVSVFHKTDRELSVLLDRLVAFVGKQQFQHRQKLLEVMSANPFDRHLPNLL